MTVLAAGDAGYIRSHVALALADRGERAARRRRGTRADGHPQARRHERDPSRDLEPRRGFLPGSPRLLPAERRQDEVAARVAFGLQETPSIHGNDWDATDGTFIRDYIHVPGLADANMGLLGILRSDDEDLAADPVLKCGSGRGISVLDVVRAVERVIGRPLPITSRRPGDPPVAVADCSRLSRILRWTPPHDGLDEMVQHALTWERHLSEA